MINIKDIKTEIINDNLRGLDVYNVPNVFRVSEDKKRFYFTMVGVLVSCSYHPKHEGLNRRYENKFVLEIQHDYRSGDDVNNFNFVHNTGTYGTTFLCKTLEAAQLKMIEFLNSDFVDYREFANRKRIKQVNICKVYEVAEAQHLHHLATFPDNIKPFEMDIIKKSGKIEKFNKYVAINDNRRKAEQKYTDKLNKRFKMDFKKDLRPYLYHFKLCVIKLFRDLNIKDIEELNAKQQKTIKKIYHYYSY